MATKVDFSNEEWELLREAPHSVAIAVAVAGASGIFGSLKEAMATAGAMVEALQGENTLLRELCTREEIKAAQGGLRSGIKMTDIETLREHLKADAVQKAEAATSLLDQKGFAEDSSAYRAFLMATGDRVAKAAKEGGFLGFGGERVSENERAVLAALGAALGGESAI